MRQDCIQKRVAVQACLNRVLQQDIFVNNHGATVHPRRRRRSALALNLGLRVLR